MQKTNLRENKQEIDFYIAGLMDSDGHISIGRYKYKKKEGYRYRHVIYFCNTDTKLIDFFVQYLQKNNYHYYIRKRSIKKKNYLTQYEVKIVRQEEALRFLENIKPLLVGNKRSYAELSINFLRSRLSRIDDYKILRDKKGRYTRGTKPEINQLETELYNQYKKLRDPQRLHAMPLPLTLR